MAANNIEYIISNSATTTGNFVPKFIQVEQETLYECILTISTGLNWFPVKFNENHEAQMYTASTVGTERVAVTG